MKLLEALEKEKGEVRSAELIVDGEFHSIYYKLMTGENHEKAVQLSKKTKTVIERDGTSTEIAYIDDDLLRSHIIYLQMLDSEGERLFEDITKVKWIQENIAYETACYLAAIMGLKSVSDMIEEQRQMLKKMSG